MPFKIYTYEDPYKLDKADFWAEISALPHISQTVNQSSGTAEVR